MQVYPKAAKIYVHNPYFFVCCSHRNLFKEEEVTRCCLVIVTDAYHSCPRIRGALLAGTGEKIYCPVGTAHLVDREHVFFQKDIITFLSCQSKMRRS